MKSKIKVLRKGSKCFMFFLDGKFYKQQGRDSFTCKKQFLHKNSVGVEDIRCLKVGPIRQFVLNVGRNVKFPSSLTQVGLFTAVSAGQRRELKEEDSRH